jgi:UDP-2,4-diacetamido-2,4,6-trideoxy-beta-L-altropyranose hydrolase
MLVAIRADSSVHIGTGHVMRCITLAEALISVGYEVVFVCRPQTGDLIRFIQAKNIDVISLSGLPSFKPVKNSLDYIGWLQVSVADDAKEFLEKVIEADVVITDHYAIGKEWQCSVRAALKCKIIAIDDLVREHDADLIIDQTLGRDWREYKGGVKVLAGSKYALLRSNFMSCREIARTKKNFQTPVRVLVTMGGVDADNVTLLVIRTLVNRADFRITVLLGPRAPNYLQVKQFCTRHGHMRHLDFVDDMASLMLESDIAVGAPGSTAWERACLGLPNIVIPLADNQVMIGEQLVSYQASIKVDVGMVSETLEELLDLLIIRWDYYRDRNFDVCDGKGVYRVVSAVNAMVNTPRNTECL